MPSVLINVDVVGIAACFMSDANMWKKVRFYKEETKNDDEFAKKVLYEQVTLSLFLYGSI